MRNNKGITLIALVITIIVLLILAGVSIAMLTGDNGILTQAGNAQKETTKAEAEEAVKLALNTIMTNKAASDAGVELEADQPTSAEATNIKTVITKNNPNAVVSEATGAANAVRTIKYKANANAKTVTITIDATGKITNVSDPQ